jgi:3'-phosphoadenosine 5'-phosphosulfate sulfotransferase (PAPS reductase)/FAD synthetase
MTSKQALFFNGGKESLIVLHQYMHNSIIVYVESENDFDEIKQYVAFIENYYNINIIRFSDIKTAILLLKKQGIDMVIIGCRSTDPDCEKLGTYQETDNSWPKIMRYNPLIEWTYHDVWDYIEKNNLIVCPLYEKGYTSIGNKTNTFPNYTLFGSNGYKHAKYLCDESLERIGRIKGALPYQFKGQIIRGKGLGRKLGFPTANLNANPLIDQGIYYGYCKFSGLNKNYKMVMSTGTNLQFDDTSTEIHILDIPDEDFYDKILEIIVIGYIRNMQKFTCIDDLIEIIKHDILIAKHHLTTLI